MGRARSLFPRLEELVGQSTYLATVRAYHAEVGWIKLGENQRKRCHPVDAFAHARVVIGAEEVESALSHRNHMQEIKRMMGERRGISVGSPSNSCGV